MDSSPGEEVEGGATPDQISRTARKAFGWSFLNTVVARFGTLIIGVALARLLGPESFGAFAVATVALLGILSFNDLGVSLAIVRWKGDPARIAPTVNAVSITTSLVLTAGVFVAAPAFASSMGSPEATNVVRVMGIAILINSVVATPAALLQREFEQRRRMVADQANIWIGAVLSLVLALAGLGAMSLAIGRIAGSLISGCLLLRWSPLPYRIGFDRSIAAGLLRFGLPLAGSSIVVFAAGYVDQLTTGAVLGATALGFYVLAANLASWPVAIFSQPLRSVSPAAFARMADDGATRPRAFLTTARVLVTATIPLCLAIGGAADQVVRFVYGAAWAPASSALTFLAMVAAAKIFFELSYDYLVVDGRTRSILMVQGIWLVALLPAVVVGAHLDGIRGIAIAQACVVVLVVTPAYGILLRRRGVALRGLVSLAWRPILGGAVVFAVGVTLGHSIPHHHLLASALTAIAGLIVVGILVILDRSLRAMVTEHLQRSRE